MCVIANHVHYVMKINQAFPIFLVYVEKHGKAWVRGYVRTACTSIAAIAHVHILADHVTRSISYPRNSLLVLQLRSQRAPKRRRLE